jgi:hypothetical protein
MINIYTATVTEEGHSLGEFIIKHSKAFISVDLALKQLGVWKQDDESESDSTYVAAYYDYLLVKTEVATEILSELLEGVTVPIFDETQTVVWPE